MENKKVVILIPSLSPNERLKDLINELTNNNYRDIIVVNDGSDYSYDNIFKEIKDKVILLKHNINLGKGRALKTGFNEYLNIFNDKIGVITVDSDGQHKINDIEKVYKEFLKHNDKLILGSRQFNEKNVPMRSKFGNILTRNIFGFLTGIKVKDTQTGLRAIPNDFILKILKMRGERFEYELNMLLYAKQYNIDIKEVIIETVYLENNKSSHFHPLKDSMRVYGVFAKYILSSGIAFIVDIGLYKLFFDVLIFTIKSYAVILATIMARIISAITNYLINKNSVFKNSNKNSNKKYFTLCTIQMFVSACFVYLLYNYIGKCEIFIKIAVDIILFFINFRIQREWVFRKDNK